MRRHGVRFECLRMRPHDHIGWVFAGEAAFEELACPFLAEGAARGERLMYGAEAPRPATAARLRDRYGSRVITIASIADVYGESGLVDPVIQRATFAGALADALADGFSGIRVAADNTPLVTDETRLAAWIRWEHVADRFMADNPVTGLCAFDGQRVDVNRLRHLSTLHPLAATTDPEPQFRMYSDDGFLCLEGHVDSFTVTQLPGALEVLPPDTGVLIDLSVATLMSRVPLNGLQRLAAAGVPVTIRAERKALDALVGNGMRPDGHLRLEVAGSEAPPESEIA
jgi:MEDS: MEthanogen/methylotroph, DcmR Sensory domain